MIVSAGELLARIDAIRRSVEAVAQRRASARDDVDREQADVDLLALEGAIIAAESRMSAHVRASVADALTGRSPRERLERAELERLASVYGFRLVTREQLEELMRAAGEGAD